MANACGHYEISVTLNENIHPLSEMELHFQPFLFLNACIRFELNQIIKLNKLKNRWVISTAIALQFLYALW